MVMKKISDVTDVYFFICTIVNENINIRVKTLKKKRKKVTFSDFYCLINKKFWITNEKNVYKKSHF